MYVFSTGVLIYILFTVRLSSHRQFSIVFVLESFCHCDSCRIFCRAVPVRTVGSVFSILFFFLLSQH